MSDIFNKKSFNTDQRAPSKDSPYYTNKVITTTRDDIKVVDADSFTLFTDSFRGGTRLYGVDAPETSIYEKANARTRRQRAEAKKEYTTQRKEAGRPLDKMYEISQDFGAEATGIAKEFINDSTEIHVRLKQMDASGGRRIVEVYNQDGESLATHLVEEGAAFATLPGDSNFDGSKEAFERYELMLEAYKDRRGIFAEDDFVLPSDFRKGDLSKQYRDRLETQVKVEEFKYRGIGNNQYAYVLADDDTYFTLPASLGASYHHGANLEHNLMEQNNYLNLAQATHYKGLAESIMEYNSYMLNGKELSTFDRFLARSYDSGLQAGGIGNWLNREVFIPRGWGRVYKDEKGAIASIAGLAGRILDESYMYYANLNPDWVTIGRDLSSGIGYGALEDNNQGIFQTTFENMASFGESMAQSLGMYLAITAPMEMMGAGLMKDAMDSMIKGTMIDNTRLNALDPFDLDPKRAGWKLGRKPGFFQKFMAEFFLGDLGHQVAARPGGMTAYLLEERFALDEVRVHGRKKAFFDHSDGPKTGMHAMQVIGRGRARMVLEGTFKPFLIDLVNPFDGTLEADRLIKDPIAPGGMRPGNAYDEFNLRVNKLIDVIASPVDLHVKVRAGETLEFKSVEVVEDIQAAKEKVGGVKRLKVVRNESRKAVKNYTQLKEEYNKYAQKINSQMIDNNRELIKILKKNGLTEAEARNYIFKGGDQQAYRGKKPSFTTKADQDMAALRMKNKREFVTAKNNLRSQLGSYADKLETVTTNTGMGYKTAIASSVQDILNMMPLNPLKWGMFSRSAENADEFITIGELFSFKHAAEFTQEVLTGENSMSRLFLEFEPAVPDQVIDGRFITKTEHISNVAKARLQSTDKLLGKAWDSIKKFFTGESKPGPDIDAITQKMRKAERRIAKGAREQAAARARKAGKKSKEVTQAWRDAQGFTFDVIPDVDPAKSAAELRVANVDEAVDLIEDVLNYTHEVRTKGGISHADMISAQNRTGMKNVTKEIMNVTDNFSGNIKAQKFMDGTTGYIAATVFMGMALNNIMQSTGGVSIASQLGLSIFGEDEDIAVRFQGNRFLPTEALATAFGWDVTATNLVADTVMIGGVLGVAHNIAKSIKTRGYMPYTFDEQTIYKMAENARFEFQVMENGTAKTIQKDFLEKMKQSKNVTLVNYGKDSTGNWVRKTTVLTRVAGGFRSERILQSFAENVPSKTFIFGAIGLLAIEGARNAAGTLLQAMSESPDDKNYMTNIMLPTVGLSFIAGAGFSPMFQVPPATQSSSAIVKTGGQVASKTKLQKALRGGMGWAIGAAAVTGSIYIAKLVLDPDIQQAGSLDPLVAGLATGIGVGFFKNSGAIGAVAGLAAMSAMAAVNWAGIRFLTVGRAGAEVDPHTSKLVSQLSQFSTAVLEAEKDDVVFHTMMAAYAGQFAAGKSILAQDPKTVAGEVQVTAKQSPLPFLQFFVAERVKGPRGSFFQGGVPDNQNTVRTYSLGIQSGALFGTSISVELPVSYTPGQGFFGFTYNSENNLMAVPNFAVKVGVWAGATTAAVGVGYQFGAALNSFAYRMTGAEFFKEGAQNFRNGAKDLFEASRVVVSAAEKISSFFIRQTVGIFATLQGTDARLAYETYKNSVTRVDAVNDAMQADDITKASLLDAGTDTFDDVDATKQGFEKLIDDVGQMRVTKVVKSSKHFMVGMIVGAIAGSLFHEVVKQRALETAHEAGANYETLLKVEEQAESRAIIYTVMGGMAGGLINSLRPSINMIRGLRRGSRIQIAARKLGYAQGSWQRKLARKIDRTLLKSTKYVEKKYSRVLNSRIGKAARGLFNLVGTNKIAAYGAVFLAAAAFNYIKTHSEFGIATMMDRYIVYDKRGNAYDNYEQQTAPARLHQFGVVAGMATYNTAIFGLAAMPHLNQRATMLGAVNRKIAGLKKQTNTNFFKKMANFAGNMIMGVHHYRSERETQALLENLITLDREADLYDEYLALKNQHAADVQAGKSVGKAPTLDPKLQKIEDVVKLRHHLGKEELKEYMDLEAKRRGLVRVGQDLDSKEMKTYTDFLHRMSGYLDQADELKHLSRGFRQTAKFTSFAKRAGAFIAVSYVIGLGIKTVMNQGGEVGHDSMLDRVYNRANQGSKFGQRGPDGRYGGIVDGLWHVGADMLRLITNRDVVDLNYAVDALNGKMVRTTGQRLVSNAKGVKEAQETISDLSEMLILDNPNAYIATFDFGGKTLRHGDKGVTTSSYFQLQGPAQDISTATYSMAAKFIFNQYTAGKGRLATIIDRGLRDFDPNDPESFDKAALAIRNASSMMHAMKTSRKYSRATAETAAQFAGDSLVSAIIAKRQMALAHQAWQPVDSLFTNMFFETVDKAKYRGQQQGLVGFLEAMARNQRDALAIFSDLMAGGMFENFFRRTAISNVKFFAGSFGKPPKQQGPQIMTADISALWHQTHDLTVQAEMFHRSKSEIMQSVSDTVQPMFNHSIMTMLPNWVKIGGAAVTTLGLTAVITMMLASYTNMKTYKQQTGEMLEVFGRKTQVGAMDIVPDDVAEVQKQLRKHIADGSKVEWEARKGSTSRTKIMTDKAAQAAGDYKARNIGIMNVSQAGKKEMIRFQLSVYSNNLSDADFDEFVKAIQSKGDDIRNLFEYVDEATGSRKNIATALTDLNEVRTFLRNIGVDPNVENIYDIFRGTQTGAVDKNAFTVATVKDFQDKFEQGLNKMYDLVDDIDNANHHMFQELTITLEDGTQKTILRGELMDPTFDIESVTMDTADTQGPGTNIEARKQALKDKYRSAKKVFQDEVENIVREEMENMTFNSKTMSPEEQVQAVQNARRQALQRIRAQVADGTTPIGAVSRGYGIITPETMVDEKAAREAAAKGQRPKAGAPPVNDWVDEVMDSLHYSRPKGTVTFWDSLGVGGRGLMTAGFTIFDVLTGADILGSYLRMADVLSNPSASSLDIEMQKKELGRAMLTSLIGLAMGATLGKLSKLGEVEWIKKAIKSPKFWAIGIGGTAAAGLTLGALNKSLVQPAMKKVGKFMDQNKVGQKVKAMWDKVWYTAADFTGELAAAPVIGAYKAGEALGGFGEEAAFFTGGFLGGAALTAVIGIGLIGIIGISALPLALTALGVGMVTGVAALFFGKQMTSGINYATKEIQKIPFVGQMAGMTDPYRQIRSQERFKHHFVNSPFLLGYVGDIINNNWMVTLGAAEDHTGRDQVSNFFGEILAEGEGYGEAHSAWKRQAADGLIGRPKPIVDEVIQQELRIRAEFYSDNVVGRYTWEQLVKYSDSNAAIRGMEARARADRIRIQEAARVKLMKASMEAGGPREAMRANSPRKAAVIGVAAARVDQVYRDLDTDTSSIKVTAATLTTHKSNVKNSDQKQADEVKAMSIVAGPGLIPPLTLASVYTARIYMDRDTATVDYEKKPSDMNPILQQEAQVITGGKGKTPEQQAQADAYNSYKDES